MERLRLGWVGLGRHSTMFLMPAMKNLPAELVAVCDTDREKTAPFEKEGCRAYVDYREIEGVDAVVCAVEYDVHYPVAMHFLKKGLPVFIEKSPCADFDEARTLAAAENASAGFVQVGFNRRFMPSYVMARNIVSRPEFGRTTMVLAKYNAGPYASETYFVRNHILNHLDLMRFLIGEIARVHVERVRVDGGRVGFGISMAAESGAIALLQSGSLQHIQYPMERVEVTGIGYNVIVDNCKSLQYQRPPVDKLMPGGPNMDDACDTLMWQPNHGLPASNILLGFEEELRHFVLSALGLRAPELTFQDTVHTMALLEAVRGESAKLC